MGSEAGRISDANAMHSMEKTNANKHAVIGTLKGYDQLMNLVLDEVKEAMTGRQL